MPELRKDPVINRWVIIAAERAQRPSDFGTIHAQRKGGFCPFCTGNEDKTPPEVLSFREAGTKPNTPGWWTRVVTNKFPALDPSVEPSRAGHGMYDTIKGFGVHEIIIETPEHDKSLVSLEPKKVEEMVWAYRDRMMEMKKDIRLKYALIFKNHGEAAGASLEHSHSQLIATPIVPKRVQEEMEGSRQYFDYKERCVFCDIVHEEIGANERFVAKNDDFISFVPFAARFPFESWVMPVKHSHAFEDLKKNEVVSLAAILQETLYRISEALDDPPYNYMVHTSPLREPQSGYYHWHIEIIPKLTKMAGFEWGTGFYINPTPPEDAAKFLREVKL